MFKFKDTKIEIFTFHIHRQGYITFS